MVTTYMSLYIESMFISFISYNNTCMYMYMYIMYNTLDYSLDIINMYTVKPPIVDPLR